MKWVSIFFGGILFGAGLVVSGMTDPVRVIGFLDFFGNWDPALVFVMGGAVVAFGVGLAILKKTGARVDGIDLPDTSADPISKQMLIGSAIFGIGWGIGGFCPGPALANLTTARLDALAFVPAMLAGMVLAQVVFKVDR